jgi:hypothetical protein
MMTYDPQSDLRELKVWYAIENGQLFLPAIVIEQQENIITLLCITRNWVPRLDLTHLEDQQRLYLRWQTYPQDKRYGRRIPRAHARRSQQNQGFI